MSPFGVWFMHKFRATFLSTPIVVKHEHLVFFEAFFNVFCVYIVSCVCVTGSTLPRLRVLILIKILKIFGNYMSRNVFDKAYN